MQEPSVMSRLPTPQKTSGGRSPPGTDHWPLTIDHWYLCRLPRTLGFQLLLHVHLDLLGLGFFLLAQTNLQHPLIVAGVNIFHVHDARQSEGTGETAVLPLYPAIVLFLLFLFELAFAPDGQGVVLQADINVLLLNSGNFHLEGNVVLVLVNVHGWREGGGRQPLFAGLPETLLKQAVHPVLHRCQLTEGVPTSQNRHFHSPPL